MPTTPCRGLGMLFSGEGAALPQQLVAVDALGEGFDIVCRHAARREMVSPAIDHGDDADNLLRRELFEALRGTAVPAESALRRFVRNLRVEAMVLFAVVIAAAVLGASAPPGSG